MNKHRLASVLLARSHIVRQIIRSEQPDPLLVDRIRYLQALAGVTTVTVFKKGEPTSYPEYDIPTALLQSGQWQQALTTAFQGSLGRAFYKDDNGQPFYLFFAPHFIEGKPPSAVILAQVNLGLIKDSWEVSRYRVSLLNDEGEIMFENNVVVPDNAIVVERKNNQLNATLRLSSNPPSILGNWWLRSILVSLMLVIAGLLFARQFERRRLLTQLAEERQGEALRLEKQVTERTEQLEQAQKQLLQTEKLALLGQMSASISHEINQPLAAVKNYSNTAKRLLEKGDGASVIKNLDLISRMTDRVSRIVVNLRSFARNEPTNVQSVLVSEVIDEAMAELADRFPESKKFCKTSYGLDAKSTRAIAGRIRLLQVLANLLTNAWYACRHEEHPSITITNSYKAPYIIISVSDNGPGFEAENEQSAFDAFVTSRGHESGLGLGLSISRSFIESMGGTLELEPSCEGGATLVIRLEKFLES